MSKAKIEEKFKIRRADSRKYVLSDQKNLLILQKVYQLEEPKLSKEDKNLIFFIRTQLKRDWQTPVIAFLNKMLKKYKNP
jgi:hypothetical protein